MMDLSRAAAIQEQPRVIDLRSRARRPVLGPPIAEMTVYSLGATLYMRKTVFVHGQRLIKTTGYDPALPTYPDGLDVVVDVTSISADDTRWVYAWVNLDTVESGATMMTTADKALDDSGGPIRRINLSQWTKRVTGGVTSWEFVQFANQAAEFHGVIGS